MRTKPSNSGLLWSLPILAAIAGLYAWIVWLRGAPTPASRIGLTLGIVGLAMMLCAEIFYTLRKRLRRLSTGRMSVWLQTHIFLGIVGPSIIMLHTSGRFHGLAAIAALLTAITVFSGFVGRFLYTSVPRAIDGGELGMEELAARFREVDARLARLDDRLRGAVREILRQSPEKIAWHTPYSRPLTAWRYRRFVSRQLGNVDNIEPAWRNEMVQVLVDRHEIQLDIQSLAATRRLLSHWHLFHVPLGMVLFTVVLVHVLAAIYYTPWRN